MHEQLQHTRQQWLQAYYDGDALQLAQHEHPQFQLHNRLSGHIEGRERHEHIAFAVAHQVWKPARWHIACERFAFSDDGLQCQVAAEADAPAVSIQEFWVWEQCWRIVQCVLASVPENTAITPTSDHTGLTGRL